MKGKGFALLLCLAVVLVGQETLPVLWELEVLVPSSNDKGPPGILVGNLTVVSTERSHVICSELGVVSVDDRGRVLWQRLASEPRERIACDVDSTGSSYWANQDGLVVSLSPDGQVKWSLAMQGSARCTSIAGNGKGGAWLVISHLSEGTRQTSRLTQYGPGGSDHSISVPNGSVLKRDSSGFVFLFSPTAAGLRISRVN